MKKTISLFVLVMLGMSAFSQGIEFEHGTWAEVKAQAKARNKAIFVDVYTSWCGPCRTMSTTVFPLPEVGKVYNEHFVCYKIDAEKGEGIAIAKEYDVKAYPSYLFVSADGTLIMKSLGSMPAEKFIELASQVKAEINSPKPISQWDNEYISSKNDPAFMLSYIQKQMQVGRPVAKFFNEYLALLKPEERYSDDIIDIYKKENRNILLNTLAYDNLIANSKAIAPKMGMYYQAIIGSAVDNTVREASATRNEKLLEDAIQANNDLKPSAAKKTAEQIRMAYYKKTGNTALFTSNASIYAEQSLMKVSVDSMRKSDIRSVAEFDKSLSSGIITTKLDSAQINNVRNYLKSATQDKFSSALNDLAWTFYETIDDKKALDKALGWSARSLEIYPENPMLMDTYANLLFKLGKKKDAIKKEKQALELAKKQHADVKGYEETLAKMQGQKK